MFHLYFQLEVVGVNKYNNLLTVSYDYNNFPELPFFLLEYFN